MNQNNDVSVRVSAEVDPRATRDMNRLGRDTRAARRTMTEGMERDTRQTARFEQVHHRLGSTLGKQTRRVMDYSKNIAKAAHQNRAFRMSLQGMNKGLDAVDNKWAAVGGTLGGAAVARGVVTLSERYERLGIQAGLSSDKVKALKDEVFAISQRQGIRVNDLEVLGAIEQIVERTGDLDLARRNIANIAMTLQATGAAGQDVGAMVADMSEKFGITNAGEMLAQLDTLVVQGKEGAFTLQALASKGSRVSAAYASMGRTGKSAVQEMGALLQVSMMGTGEADVAATAFEATLRDLVSNRDKLEGLGVELFDPEKLAQGKEEARSIPQVLKEIVKATNGNVSEFSEVFGDESRRLVNVLASEYQKTGGFASLDKFMSIQGDGTQIMADSSRASQTAAAAMNNFANAWRRMADGSLAEPIQALADAMNSLDPDTVQTIMKSLAGGALALGGLAIGRRVLGAGRSIAGMVRGKKGGGAAGGIGGALASAGGVQPVFVTNFPGGVGAGMGMGGSSSARRSGYSGSLPKSSARPTTRASRLTQWGRHGSGAMKLMGKAAMPLMLAGGALSVGSTLSDDGLSRAEKAKAVSSDVGGMGGALAGAAAGAAMGSVVPLIGTAVGGILGGILGGMGGEWLGGKVGGAMNPIEQEVKRANARPKAIAGTGSNTPAVTRQITNSVPIQITQQPGQSSQQLAVQVADEVEKVLEKQRLKSELSLMDNYSLGNA
ncbi:phage tail tape measure protein [Thalassotalea sp. G20_0]|uniref:phage tail tape measure protein n=1 Tax=Thalassotalea sp. G20_0 TaxID=2821093 RepID=UPI001ADA33A1|nr:phage tail tape measure protein [Thalassotalea sp. G20_0]MBO9493842.1 phage tail tape measure protein [Thalassotalea sp. G20_0]